MIVIFIFLLFKIITTKIMNLLRLFKKILKKIFSIMNANNRNFFFTYFITGRYFKESCS